MKKHTYEFVKQFFEDNGCVLLSHSYISGKQKLSYICVCGNASEIRFDAFKRGARCIPCGIKKGSQNHKHKIDDIRKIFSDGGCILVSMEFVDARTPLEYICSCGNPNKITLDNFKRGKRCKKCGINKLSLQLKHSYEFVKNIFIENNCILIDEEYTNGHTPLRYICECGAEKEISLFDLQAGKRCWDCGRKKLADSHRLSFEYVDNFFTEQDCILLSTEYQNAHQILDYICQCGKPSKIKFDKFRIGQRCAECGDLKNSGKNHWKYDENISDEERVLRRSFPAYKQWVRAVFERDSFTCQCCGQYGGKLHAHHLDGYSWCTVRRLDITNGVTLCELCHDDFHGIYTNFNNTESQWKEYMKNLFKEDPVYMLI